MRSAWLGPCAHRSQKRARRDQRPQRDGPQGSSRSAELMPTEGREAERLEATGPPSAPRIAPPSPGHEARPPCPPGLQRPGVDSGRERNHAAPGLRGIGQGGRRTPCGRGDAHPLWTRICRQPPTSGPDGWVGALPLLLGHGLEGLREQGLRVLVLHVLTEPGPAPALATQRATPPPPVLVRGALCSKPRCRVAP